MDKYLELCHNQDEVMEHIMLFAPMSTLSAIQDSFAESMLADEYMACEEIFGGVRPRPQRPQPVPQESPCGTPCTEQTPQAV